MNINELTLSTSLTGADNFPIYSTSNGRTRAVTASQISDFIKTDINPIVDVTRTGNVLTFYKSDGTTITITI